MNTRNRTTGGDRRGFTLIESLIAMTLGLIVITATMSFAWGTFRGLEGDRVREEVYRNARFLGMSLERDFQTAGVAMESTVSFGTLAVWADTVVILSVPFEPRQAPVHDVVPPDGSPDPLPPGGTCGTYCLDLAKVDGEISLDEGDLARLQVNDVRRLILVREVVDEGETFRVGFTEHERILHYKAGLTDLQLSRSGSFVQRLSPIVYYSEDNKLKRAQALGLDGSLRGATMAYGVRQWDAWLMFVDGDEAENADVEDGDATNDYDDLLGVRIETQLTANRPDLRVNRGEIFTRSYEWKFVPRNLMYERNR